MFRAFRTPMAAGVLLAASASTSFAQHGQHLALHVDPNVKECSFRLDASLTQAAWRQFTREAGLVTYFRPLVDAQPMGRGKFEVSLLQWNTAIDDNTHAWNDTFVHPDSAHWLFEGSGLSFPGVTARAGLSDRVDAGLYFTKNPRANYGFVGGQLQYNLLRDAAKRWAISARASVTSMYGPKDLDFAVVGLDAVASRTWQPTTWSKVSPYIAATTYFAHAHEKSAVVNLKDENVDGSSASAGVVLQLSVLRIAGEYNAARVNSKSLKVGVSF